MREVDSRVRGGADRRYILESGGSQVVGDEKMERERMAQTVELNFQSVRSRPSSDDEDGVLENENFQAEFCLLTVGGDGCAQI